uniref:Disease resistance protein RPS4B/Roq1-like leucine-rich repeats domain-containing protein n=1 Tax=Fagus sylvatica TaxID=28930 RepID=A0A2N9FAW2_FAGSY
MVLKLREPKEAYWRPESFSKLHHLKLLIIDSVHLSHDPKHLPNSLRIIDWSGYPSKSIPSKSFERLKSIRLRKSPKLVETLDFTKVPVLEKLVLEDCINLPGVHPSIRVHKKLKVVSLKGCKNLKSLPSKFAMESLEILILSGCSKVKTIPEFGGNMERVCKLYLDGTAITKLHESIENLTGLASLKLKDCKNLVCVPSTIFNLKLLKDVDISGCSKFERLPEILGNAESVEELDVSETAIRHVPSSIGRLKNLKRLIFEGMLNLSDCNLKAIPNDIGILFSLRSLSLNGNKLVCLPESIGQLSGLSDLDLWINYPEIVIPGSEIPEWFSHQSMGPEGKFRSTKEVKKCGVRLLYKKDIEDPIPTTPYERLDVPHHNFNNWTVLTEGNKVKRRRDEYDGAGTSGEGSSNDVPHPKRIERPTEFGNSDSEESSEYKDCDEELSDVQ